MTGICLKVQSQKLDPFVPPDFNYFCLFIYFYLFEARNFMNLTIENIILFYI